MKKSTSLSHPKRRKRAPKSVAKTDITQFWSGSVGSWQSSLFGPHEPFSGAWQRNIGGMSGSASPLAFSAVYCCVTGIASDIGKMPPDLMRETTTPDVWEKVREASPFKPVLRKPNHYQNRIQFLVNWIISKLLSGNTFIVKERDNRGIVQRMHVLDPRKVQVLVAASGDVYYGLGEDRLNWIYESLVVPASEIIHDRMEPLFHPLIGVSPLYACMTTVGLGNSIQSNSQTFFGNASQPGGMLTAPGRISDGTAKRMKAEFEQRFSGNNIGRLFVAGDGLTFNPFALTAQASQLVEQLQWSVEDVARAFHYPIYKLDNSKLPPYSGNNIQTLNMQYLSDCLQKHVEDIELLLEDGLEIPSDMHIVLDTEVLLRMDTQTMYKTISEGIRGQWLAPNEGRARANLKPVKGGEYPRAQVQYVPLPDIKNQQAVEQTVPREYAADLIAAAIRKELENSSA